MIIAKSLILRENKFMAARLKFGEAPWNQVKFV